MIGESERHRTVVETVAAGEMAARWRCVEPLSIRFGQHAANDAPQLDFAGGNQA